MGSCLASKHQGRPSPTEALILDVYCFATELKLIAFVPSCFESATACAMRASHYRTGLDKVSEWLVVIVGLYFLSAFRLARAESAYMCLSMAGCGFKVVAFRAACDANIGLML